MLFSCSIVLPTLIKIRIFTGLEAHVIQITQMGPCPASYQQKLKKKNHSMSWKSVHTTGWGLQQLNQLQNELCNCYWHLNIFHQ